MDIFELASMLSLPEYEIEVGVVSANTTRKESVKIGMTNAEILFVNENGSPINHVPARPVLDMTIRWVNDSGLLDRTLEKCIKIWLESGKEDMVDKEINKMCLKIQNYARNIIYSNDGRLTPNAPSTIRKKGDNHPLFDTGQLARSITCRARRII